MGTYRRHMLTGREKAHLWDNGLLSKKFLAGGNVPQLRGGSGLPPTPPTAWDRHPRGPKARLLWPPDNFRPTRVLSMNEVYAGHELAVRTRLRISMTSV